MSPKGARLALAQHYEDSYQSDPQQDNQHDEPAQYWI